MTRYGENTKMSANRSSDELLLNESAFQYLVDHANEEEASTSEYWIEQKENFTVARDGTVTGSTVLGNASNKRSFLRTAAHRILQQPLKRLARQYGDLKGCERLGRLVAKRQGRLFTYDMLRHVFTLALIKHHNIETTQTGNALIIGDGFGTMASLLLMNSPDIRIFLANLTKPLLLDLIYLRRGFPDINIALVTSEKGMAAALADPTIRIVAVQADNSTLLTAVPIRLAINIVSMQEMDPPVVASYFDILRRNPAEKTAFYCCNKKVKVSNFKDYPWRDGDLVFEDSICEWSQHYYKSKPPFIYKRPYGDKVILHRFVELEKNHD
jgi:hypothetical protein